MHTVIWYQVFLSNTNDYIVSRNYFYLVIIICLYTVIWFQVTNPLATIITWWYYSWYKQFTIIGFSSIPIQLHTVIWYQVGAHGVMIIVIANKHMYISIYIGIMVRVFANGPETWIQSQVESYQRIKKWCLIPPCLTLSSIKYGSRKVKPSRERSSALPIPGCNSYWKKYILFFSLASLFSDISTLVNYLMPKLSSKKKKTVVVLLFNQYLGTCISHGSRGKEQVCLKVINVRSRVVEFSIFAHWFSNGRNGWWKKIVCFGDRL